MNTHNSVTSERGIALVVVLLLMAILSGLATGFAMTGHIESQMSSNEVYFAGARAAAEAGLNRAIVEIIADTTTNFLAGQDGAVDAATPTAAVNTDNCCVENAAQSSVVSAVSVVLDSATIWSVLSAGMFEAMRSSL